MKSFLYYFVLAALVVNIYAGVEHWSKEDLDRLKEISKKCQKESGATDDEIQDVRTKNHFSDSPQMKEHILCISEEVHLINSDGEINKHVLRKKLEKTYEAEEEEIVEECAVQKDSKEETAHHLLKCVLTKNPDFRTANKEAES